VQGTATQRRAIASLLRRILKEVEWIEARAKNPSLPKSESEEATMRLGILKDSLKSEKKRLELNKNQGELNVVEDAFYLPVVCRVYGSIRRIRKGSRPSHGWTDSLYLARGDLRQKLIQLESESSTPM
jgi:hypothetical protein